jgi:hypothetical protein
MNRMDFHVDAGGPAAGDQSEGCLYVSVLSVYDLPWDDTPTVLVSACGRTVTTGPPVSRDRHRNSFRFNRSCSIDSSSTNTSFDENNNTTSPNYGYESVDGTAGSGTTTPATSNAALRPPSTSPLQLFASLRDLYRCTVQIRVIYPQKKNSPFLETYLDLRDQLRINENKWVLLQLKPTATTSLARAALETTVPSSSSSLQQRTSSREDLPEERPVPTIRLKLLLKGNCRPEITSLIRFCETYFGFIDSAGMKIHEILKTIRFDEYGKFFLLPIIPIAVGALVASPLLASIFMVGLPIFLPLVLAVIGIFVGFIFLTSIIMASTQQGREQWSPYLTYFVDTPLGQRLMYETGPRPTIVSILKRILPTSRRPNNIYDDDIDDDDTTVDPMTQIWTKLVLSLGIDLIGSATYMLPVVGEVLDLVWAPIQTVTIMAMYDYVTPHLQYVSFMEEILPFTDILPSATIGWSIEYVPLLTYSSDKDGTFTIEQVVSDLTLTDREDESLPES